MKKIISALTSAGLLLGSLCVYAYDVNNDKNVDVFDVVTLRSYIVNSEVLSKDMFESADVSDDGHVDISDVVILRSYIVNGVPVNNEGGSESSSNSTTTTTTTPAEDSNTQATDTDSLLDVTTDTQPDDIQSSSSETTTTTTATTTTTTTDKIVAGAQQKPTESGTQETETFRLEVLRLINIEREKEGLDPLEYSKELEAPAQIRADDIVLDFSHTRPNGEPWFNLIYDTEVNWRGIGENLAAGYATPEQVVKAWMKSEGHRENILDPSYTHMSIGYVEREGPYKYYWVQWFAEIK